MPTKGNKEGRTERRTPIPAKMTCAGENTYQINIRMQISDESVSTYQANTYSKGLREGIKDIDCWVEPTCQPVVGASRLVEVLDLLLKYSKNGGRRIAGLELGGEGMREKVLLCLPFVRF